MVLSLWPSLILQNHDQNPTCDNSFSDCISCVLAYNFASKPLQAKMKNIASAWALLGWAAQCAVAEVKYPATVEIDVVFPLEGKTYNNMKEIPVVFAIQNAEAFFDWGPTLSYTLAVAGKDGDDRIAANTDLYGTLPLDTIDNMWCASSKIGNRTIEAGKYTLNWTLGVVTCTKSGDKVDHHYDQNPAKGLVQFTLVDDNSGTGFNLTDECPIYGGIVSATGSSFGCPFIDTASNKGKADSDPCRAKVPADMAACIMANLTDSGDRSACQKVIDKHGGQKGDDNAGGGGSGSGGSGNNTGNGDGKDKDDGASLYVPSTTLLVLAVAIAIAFV